MLKDIEPSNYTEINRVPFLYVAFADITQIIQPGWLVTRGRGEDGRDYLFVYAPRTAPDANDQ